MSDELVPVVGGPKDGELWRWSTANTLTIPDAKDRIEKITPEGLVSLFGQHTYRLNCYAKDGAKVYRWDYVGYEPPWNIPASDDIVDRIRFALSGDTFWDTNAPPLLEDAVKEIERLRSERKWIPVSERLPDTDGEVLLYVDDYGGWITKGSLSQGGWYVNESSEGAGPASLTRFSHWMPLPEPPSA